MIALETAQAASFLSVLGLDGERVTFQTFADAGRASKLTNVIHAQIPIDDGDITQLVKLNTEGAGIFATVNATDGKGRAAANITRVRAVFVDLDGAPLEPVLTGPLAPTITVESSPGRYHAYWTIADMPLEEFGTAQSVLAARYNGDPVVRDLPRVMRLPGFAHQKGEPYLTRVLESHPKRLYTRRELLEAYPEIRAALETTQQLRQHPKIPAGKPGQPEAAQRKYALAALDREVQAVRAARKGTRNNTLNVAAFALGQLVGAGVLLENAVRAELEDAAHRVGLPENEARAAINSGLSAGKLEPRDLRDIGRASAASTRPVRRTSSTSEQPRFDRAAPEANAIRSPEQGKGYNAQDVLILLGYGEWGLNAADTDVSLAARAKHYLGGDLAYAPGLGWAVWQGKCWQVDEGRSSVLARKMIEQLAGVVRAESAHLYDCVAALARADRDADAKRLSVLAGAHLGFAAKCESATKIKAALEIGAGHLYADLERFEPKPWVLGLNNRTWAHGTVR